MDFKTMALEQTRLYLTEELRKGIQTITFIKVDGTERVMPCTLNADLIPPAPVKVIDKSKPPRKIPAENPAVMRVFCTDKQEWRSFRVDSVTGIN